MRRTNLIATLVGLAVVSMFSGDAFARGRMYHPGLGRFLQRDPIGTPLEPPMARNLSGAQFTSRDSTSQYVDGMNIYQYGRSNPVQALDPSGTVVIGLGGLFELGREEVHQICTEVARRVNGKLPGLRNGQGEFAAIYSGAAGLGKGAVELHMKFFRRKKDNDDCWHEQLVLVGFSDGATTLYQVFNEGTAGGELTSKEHGGIYSVAYLGLIDMIRTDFNQTKEEWLSRPGKSVAMAQGGVTIVGSHNFYQQNDSGSNHWKGHVKIGSLTSDPDPRPGVSHKGQLAGAVGIQANQHDPPSIMKDAAMRAQLIEEAVQAYVKQEERHRGPKSVRTPLVD